MALYEVSRDSWIAKEFADACIIDENDEEYEPYHVINGIDNLCLVNGRVYRVNKYLVRAEPYSTSYDTAGQEQIFDKSSPHRRGSSICPGPATQSWRSSSTAWTTRPWKSPC